MLPHANGNFTLPAPLPFTSPPFPSHFPLILHSRLVYTHFPITCYFLSTPISPFTSYSIHTHFPLTYHLLPTQIPLSSRSVSAQILFSFRSSLSLYSVSLSCLSISIFLFICQSLSPSPPSLSFLVTHFRFPSPPKFPLTSSSIPTRFPLRSHSPPSPSRRRPHSILTHFLLPSS